MGVRKYIYLAIFAVFGIMYLGVHQRNKSFSYKWPLGPEKTIGIVTYGNSVWPDDLAYVRRIIESVYGVKTVLVPRDPEELKEHYEAKRKQYNIGRLLEKLELEAQMQRPHFRTLVVLREDIFDDGSNFVFGIGAEPGQTAAITTSGYGLDLGDTRLEHFFHTKIMRVLTLHEIGHTLGLAHCTNKCVMESGNNVIQEMKKHDEYCKACEQQLRELAARNFPTMMAWPS